jgi:mannosylglycoprotein endo-beta-mannosidase
LESVVVAHEIVHNVHKSKDPGVILKLDYEKAYDRVNLDFLFEILKTKGLSSRWIWSIVSIAKGGTMGVTMNGNESPLIKSEKRLRKGYPLSPIIAGNRAFAVSKNLW